MSVAYEYQVETARRAGYCSAAQAATGAQPPQAQARRKELHVRLALTVLVLALLSEAAEAQYTLDPKGRRYKCLPGDWSCTVLPLPGASLQSGWDQRLAACASARALRLAL